MASGLNYIKMPRSVTEYTLMKGVTDYSNLKQFDIYETGYPLLTVVSIPKFMDILANKDNKVKVLQDNFIHIIESEFRGLNGVPDITSDPGTITNGVNELQIINNVTMDTSIQISMSFWERSGGVLTNYLNYYLTGLKDPYSKAKTYHGLVGNEITEPGPDNEVFSFLYYVTDNTMRKIEKAYLFCNAQPTTAPDGTLYNAQKGQFDFQEIEISFNCFPIMSDTVNKYAAMMLENDLTAPEGDSRRLVLDSNDFQFAAYDKATTTGRVSDILNNSTLASTVQDMYNS